MSTPVKNSTLTSLHVPPPAPFKPKCAHVPSEPDVVIPKNLDQEELIDVPVQKNKNKCFQCKKKVGFLGFECKCAFIFCAGCRFPSDHHCTFNFRDRDRAYLCTVVQGGGQAPKIEDKL